MKYSFHRVGHHCFCRSLRCSTYASLSVVPNICHCIPPETIVSEVIITQPIFIVNIYSLTIFGCNGSTQEYSIGAKILNLHKKKFNYSFYEPREYAGEIIYTEHIRVKPPLTPPMRFTIIEHMFRYTEAKYDRYRVITLPFLAQNKEFIKYCNANVPYSLPSQELKDEAVDLFNSYLENHPEYTITEMNCLKGLPELYAIVICNI